MELLMFIIAILALYLIYTKVKYRSVKKDLIEKEAKNQQSTIVLQNINAYFLLIDTDFVVQKTNYYSLNGLPVPQDGMTKRVGELLHCRNAIAAGECGKNEQCKLCCIRMAIGKAFRAKANFKKLEASMKLLSSDEKTVTPCDVSVSGTYLNVKGKDHMLLTVYDVTEMKNMQRLLDMERENSISAEKLKSAFIANMSHEVRTPLNAIVGFSGLMATATTEEEKKMYVDIIAENNERLLRLVNDIFDLSQIDAGNTNFTYSEFDVNDLLRELDGVYRMKLNDKPSVKLICESHMEPIMMHSERQRISQVISNLLNNSIKFTHEGEIRFGCRMEGTDKVYFYVSDTGIGIPKEEQNSIFSHFKKLDREVPGTGLGLTLSQRIISELDGKAGLESEVGKGSTFWFVLPMTAKQEISK
uniref:sensor histidine kinase n=1 Tax=uncultured Bacteroides sp. TaxID=162156 RepID=UPI0025FA85BA|nr:ATP-binding protein [uncultured Bacteroides sp.]